MRARHRGSLPALTDRNLIRSSFAQRTATPIAQASGPTRIATGAAGTSEARQTGSQALSHRVRTSAISSLFPTPPCAESSTMVTPSRTSPRAPQGATSPRILRRTRAAQVRYSGHSSEAEFENVSLSSMQMRGSPRTLSCQENFHQVSATSDNSRAASNLPSAGALR